MLRPKGNYSENRAGVKAAFAAEGIELNNNMIRIVFMTDVQVFRRRLGRFRRLVSQHER